MFDAGVPVGLRLMSPEALVMGLVWSNSMHSLLSLALGFAVAGALANGYQAVTEKPVSFQLIEQSPRNQALAALPLLIFAAPFVIMRNTIRGRRIEGRNFGFVAIATIVAGFWSLMSGTLVVMVLQGAKILA
jgi:uncharacterized protein DUF6949